ncbi:MULTISPECIES: alpha/beta fold hydrolase [Mycobacterium avium complex (MAC)]|uniref:Alpha/beta hydrolase n=2 Tax=Mycobacterium intracellulare TaxID=1767 RepID=A0AAE4UB55_MYCIT|nr:MULTISPECIES: alpha/beta hydrolase [Mycobacterium avium complex (MAC)]AFS14545.1 Epoxide hydrolase 2 [Mycobacterium intracellulare subsp. intracellulare MTCC 9506]MCA2319695.1 alpha/beta hydrolase [Mycobacterium intracellulare]MCA2340208.1 alpha/beta hydrolase [Mycobacterium intracellulare]MDV6976404.1 alpha/beta hydrolase [Mycobacterium intracellulare]MDV6981457.1 alpha/beta hydrolase [Mycobacterium intracellulare]
MSVFRVEAGVGEAVLLLHGYPQSASCWRHQIPALARDHRVIAVDWPGFGRSDPPKTPATYENEVKRLDELVASLGLRRFNLVAHDYGGFLSLGYVLRHPEKVMRLAVLNSRAHKVFRPPFYRFMLSQRWAVTHAPSIVRHLPLRRLHRLALRPYRGLGCFDDALEAEYLGWMDTARGRQTYVDFFRNYRVPAIPDLAAGLERIDCPTAIIWGDSDRTIPFATARELAARIPAAVLVRLAGADHFVMEECPDEVTAALLELLARPC